MRPFCCGAIGRSSAGYDSAILGRQVLKTASFQGADYRCLVHCC
jgi:hypothetical protein